MQLQSIKTIRKLGIQNTLDFEVNHKDHNFYAEGIVTSNSHSISTSHLSALTTLLKYKYPIIFYTECLNQIREKSNFTEMISVIVKELPYFNIKLAPPSIKRFNFDFSHKDDTIYFGIKGIKGLSQANLEKLHNFHVNDSNKFNIFDAANKCKIPLNIIKSLVFCGSMDDMLTESRAKTFLEACLWNLLTEKEKKYCMDLGAEYNFDLLKLVKELNSVRKNEKGKQIIKDSRMETLRRDFEPHREMYKHNKKYTDYAVYRAEKDLLGFSFTTNLHQIFKKFCPDLITVNEIKSSIEGEKVHFAAEVLEVKNGKSKEKQTPYLKVYANDHTADMTILMFDTEREANIQNHIEENGRQVEEGDCIVVRGTKKGDCVFAKTIGIQESDIINRVSQLKKHEQSNN